MRSLTSLLVVALAASTALAQPKEGEVPETPPVPSAEPPDSAAAPVSPDSPPPAPTDSASPPAPNEPTASPSALPPPPLDPCAGVTCGGHGTCVPHGTAPDCACSAGYQPDPTVALACVPTRPTVVPPPPPSERAQVETAEARDLGSEYDEYLRAAPGGSFAQFMYDRHGAELHLGLGLLVPGLALMLGGSAMLAAGVLTAGDHSQQQVDAGTIQSPDDYQYTGGETALVAVGAAALLVGLAGNIAGSVLFDTGREGRNRMAPLAERTATASALELRGIGPLWSAEGAPAGVSVQVGF